jgi:phospho-N-acetylmuramoyl-pentapeptide-transferase
MIKTFLIGLAVTVILCPLFIPVLTRLKAGQNIRTDGPSSHLKKSGTPTMGGLVMILAIGIALLFSAAKNLEAGLAFGLLLLSGAIGLGDDYIKVIKRRSLGLRARQKILLQVAAGAVFVFAGQVFLNNDSSIFIPFMTQPVDLGWLYVPLVILVVLATTNAVNLTDGLDGLAAGTTVISALAMGFLAYLTQHSGLEIFAGALAGASLGFWVFNRYPARVFMGDTGSMALGGGLSALAVISQTEFYFLIIGGVYVLEALSDIIQVAVYKRTHRRVFRMAPLHHHFELGGWPEKKVVRFFYLLAVIFAVAGIAAAGLTRRGV